MSAPLLATVTEADPSIGTSLLHMVLALGAVIVAILVVQKVLVAIRGGGMPRRRLGPGTQSGLQILARQNLGKGVQLAIVRYGEREVLVGVSGQQISFFETDARANELDTMTTRRSNPTPIGTDPSLGALEELLRRRGDVMQMQGASGPSIMTSSLVERLRAITERH